MSTFSYIHISYTQLIHAKLVNGKYVHEKRTPFHSYSNDVWRRQHQWMATIFIVTIRTARLLSNMHSTSNILIPLNLSNLFGLFCLFGLFGVYWFSFVVLCSSFSIYWINNIRKMGKATTAMNSSKYWYMCTFVLYAIQVECINYLEWFGVVGLFDMSKDFIHCFNHQTAVRWLCLNWYSCFRWKFARRWCWCASHLSWIWPKHCMCFTFENDFNLINRMADHKSIISVS